MKVKRINNTLIQARVDPGEALNLAARYSYPTISDAIRGGVWRLLMAHAVKELDGLKIAWGKVDFINGEYVITYGPASIGPRDVKVPNEVRQGAQA